MEKEYCWTDETGGVTLTLNQIHQALMDTSYYEAAEVISVYLINSPVARNAVLFNLAQMLREPSQMEYKRSFCKHGYNGLCPECDATNTVPRKAGEG